MKKKKKIKIKKKIKVKILLAVISAIVTILLAYINLYQKPTYSQNQNGNFGMIFNVPKGTVNISSESNSDKKDIISEEKVTLNGEMLPYVSAGYIDDEPINMYSSDGYEPLYSFQLTNENNISINIKNIIIEVLDYKDLSEFVVKRPAGGASMHDIIYWQCNISPEKTQYSSILIGTDKNNTEDLSESKYVSIEKENSGEFLLKILPDTPGLYEAKIKVKYTSYKGMTKKVELKNVKFVYDPNHEANIDPSW